MPCHGNDECAAIMMMMAAVVMVLVVVEMMTTTKHLHMLEHKYTIVGVKFNFCRLMTFNPRALYQIATNGIIV
jgi:hypothetical protein